MVDCTVANAAVSMQQRERISLPAKRFRLGTERAYAFGTHPFIRPDVSCPIED